MEEMKTTLYPGALKEKKAQPYTIVFIILGNIKEPAPFDLCRHGS